MNADALAAAIGNVGKGSGSVLEGTGSCSVPEDVSTCEEAWDSKRDAHAGKDTIAFSMLKGAMRG